MSSASDSITVNRAVRLLVALGVAVLVGRGVWQEQQAALERCAPGCDLAGWAVAGVETVVLSPVATATITVGAVPVGAIAVVILILWLLQFVRTPRV